MNTTIHYEYRDGANYKKSASWTILGMCSQNQTQALRDACINEDDHNYFVPSAVGMPDILPDEWDDEIDHPLCHITSIEMVTMPADDIRSIHELINDFKLQDWHLQIARIMQSRA